MRACLGKMKAACLSRILRLLSSTLTAQPRPLLGPFNQMLQIWGRPAGVPWTFQMGQLVVSVSDRAGWAQV